MPKNKGRKPGSGRMSRASMRKHMETRKETQEYFASLPQQPPKSQHAPITLSPMPVPSPHSSRMLGSMDKLGQREKSEKTLSKQEFRARRDRKEQGLSAGPVDSEYTSKTKRPLAPDQVRELKSSGRIDPFSVYTLQETASSQFTDGSSVMQTAIELRGSPKEKPSIKLPPIQVFREGGKVFTRDHRRVAAARRGGVSIDYELTESSKAMKDADRKRSTKSGGTVLKLNPSEQVPYSPEDLFGSDID